MAYPGVFAYFLGTSLAFNHEFKHLQDWSFGKTAERPLCMDGHIKKWHHMALQK